MRNGSEFDIEFLLAAPNSEPIRLSEQLTVGNTLRALPALSYVVSNDSKSIVYVTSPQTGLNKIDLPAFADTSDFCVPIKTSGDKVALICL